MAESCKKSLDVLKLAQSRGLPPPKHHFEERSFHTVRWAPVTVTAGRKHARNPLRAKNNLKHLG